MLSPDSRTIAFDLLRPPSGYTLDLAVLTTYTLDLEALLALPLSVVSETEGGLEELLADPLLLLEALRRAGERIQLFVDRSGIAIPRAPRELYSMLEASVHPVRAPGGGVFHPKVWVARFTPREAGSATAAGRAEGRQEGADDRPLLRVAVLTRNLTFDRSWDVALASEAHPDPEGLSEPSQPLADLIRALPDLATTSVPTDSVARAKTLADQVGRARFPAPPGFFEDPIRFHVMGLHGAHAPWRPISDGRRTLAIAPFVNRTGLEAVRGPIWGEARLVSLQSELDKLPDDALSAWNDVRTLSDLALDEEAADTAVRPSGLHAKLLAVEHGWNVTWYVGSANLTAAALLGRNVEALAEISARKGRSRGKSGFGIDRFLESGFDQLCTSYQRMETPEVDPKVTEARKQLTDARDALLEADLEVVCSGSGEEWTWALDCGGLGSETLSALAPVDVVAWPISVSEETARPLRPAPALPLPIQHLTRFVAFRLSVPVRGVDEMRLTLRLPARGMPQGRMHHALVALISDPGRFLRFLRALLGDLDALTGWNGAGGSGANGDDQGPSLDSETLLEDLVRTASRAPERLVPVRRLIADLCKTEKGRAVIPDDFLSVWEAVESAIRERAGQ